MRQRVAFIAICVVAAAVVGFTHRQVGNHTPVADWDYVDGTNHHPAPDSKGTASEPALVASANHDKVVAENGWTVKLIGVSKFNSTNPDHWWNPDGSPFTGDTGRIPLNLPEQPPVLDGRVRNLTFDISAPGDGQSEADYLGYVPRSALAGLSEQNKAFHGWDHPQTIRLNRYGVIQTATVYVDDPKAQKYEFGLASGEWKTIDTIPNPLKSAPFMGKVAGSGTWGRAVVTQALSESPTGRPMAFSKNPSTVTLTIAPPTDPAQNEVRFLAHDASGKQISVGSYQNMVILAVWDVPKIATFEVQTRRYQYLEFDGIHYDPDPGQWKNIVWGDSQSSVKSTIGDTTAEFKALISAKANDPGTRPFAQIPNPVRTPDGKEWRDHPPQYSLYGGLYYNSPNPNDKQTPISNAWVAYIDLVFPTGVPAPDGRVDVFGSNSSNPGEDLHPEWNLKPMQENMPGQLRSMEEKNLVELGLSPKAKYAQIRFQLAPQTWTLATTVTPQSDEIRPGGPDNRVLNLDVGRGISIRYKDGARQKVRTASTEQFGDTTTRVFARLKSGQRLLMKAYNYYRNGPNGSLTPSYEFDRDATATEGDVIALRDVAKFEIETRELKTGYVVVKLP